MLLTEPLKAEIQDAYRAWLAARDFRARRGQREMIAAVARALTAQEDRALAVEAGTGTGKTAAYCLAAIPIARALGKTLVISTATVALQEQVVLRDLPDLKERSGLRFNFALAKGRGRYVCLKRLDDALRAQGQQEVPLFASTTPDSLPVYQTMLERFSAGQWDGELDSWSDGVEADQWAPITTDHRGCTNSRCAFFRSCPFFKARAQLEKIDLIVANHDLLLADLSLGGGAVLPEPEECIYVIDEAHHLPEKTQNHFAVRARLGSTSMWLDQLNGVLGTVAQRFSRPQELVDAAQRIGSMVEPIGELLNGLREQALEFDFVARDEQRAIYRFPLGRVPLGVRRSAAELVEPLAEVGLTLERIHERLQQHHEGELDWPNSHEAADWLPVLGQHLGRCNAVTQLCRDYAAATLSEGEEPAPVTHARWVSAAFEDFEWVSAPIAPGELLQDVLWSPAYAVICTSATLTALGRWDRFSEHCGLPQGAQTLQLASPFRYAEIAEFRVPAMRSDPRDMEAHADEAAQLLPALLAENVSALVLFSSWRQLRRVLSLLSEEVLAKALVQGDGSKQALLAEHRKQVDRGKQSYLFGLASFAEGVDLPDDYCRHVIIMKLPFAVPDDPVDQAVAEWAEHRGRNAFYEISVPDAALKLVQACGRLIRHEADHGTITLLDRRIVTQRYGQALLRSLPPYRLALASA